MDLETLVHNNLVQLVDIAGAPCNDDTNSNADNDNNTNYVYMLYVYTYVYVYMILHDITTSFSSWTSQAEGGTHKQYIQHKK